VARARDISWRRVWLKCRRLKRPVSPSVIAERSVCSKIEISITFGFLSSWATFRK
jgi:hypothetical protein